MTVDHPLLHMTDREELFSLAYILAITSSAGYNHGRDNLDRDSADLYVRHHSIGDFIPRYQSLNIQAKCTWDYEVNKKGDIPFEISRKNYDDMRRSSQPHILVLVTVPKELIGCTEFGKDHLLLRHRAYWVSLHDLPPLKRDNQEDVTVYIPLKQEFTVESLHSLMAMIVEGKKP